MIVKQSLADQIYNLLRDDIINHTLTCGTKINVRKFQEKFSTSSTPIREALNRLQQEGLVEYVTNMGAKVIDINEKDIIEIQELNIVLDCSAIRFAMARADHKIIAAELLKYIEGERNSINYQDEISHATSFHETFYKFADNNRLHSTAQQLQAQQSILRNKYSTLNKKFHGLEEHSKIYNAILIGDTEKAVELMKEHIENAKELLLATYEKA